MQLSQSVNIIKQVLDLAIKSGAIPNLEQAAIVAEAWTTILQEIKTLTEKTSQ